MRASWQTKLIIDISLFITTIFIMKKTKTIFLALVVLPALLAALPVHTNETITIAELYANKTVYQGKTVRLHGKVVKYNPNIMGKNWVHIQDGSEYEGKNDLTITTSMTTKVGDEITVEGTVVLNKDLGAGYFYEILLEDATIVKE